MTIPLLDLRLASDPNQKQALLDLLKDCLFNVGFLYIKGHGVPEETISDLSEKLPSLFDIANSSKSRLSKSNSPHFLGYSGFAEEVTLGQQDLREQFDYATELPVIYDKDDNEIHEGKDFSKLYWWLRGPNQWPTEEELPGFRSALESYHNALADLSYRFLHLVEEAFDIPLGTFDQIFGIDTSRQVSDSITSSTSYSQTSSRKTYLPSQHRIKLVKYPATNDEVGQGVGPHKDSSGLLTFLHQVGQEKGLEVLDKDGNWIAANPIPGTFVVNFANPFEAATDGAVKATVHRVVAPTERDRYSIPFFMGLPPNLTVSEIRSCVPEAVRKMRRDEDGQEATENAVSSFLDPRWDNLGESQLRKWIRSHKDVGRKWYGDEVVDYYIQ
ncbi:Clavaminate synthase-like protein [Microthyrium microscopicum]|uniref:Clavaminate synthase-like protein n=1 Tax=Microthyrium microscopicum TaxID=703497 RepID=A0A6A6UWE6_9PEZI|nr:Clavaminate synthase-like protein [Microthyrium microscopicum]